MQYTTTVSFGPEERPALAQAERNAGVVFPEGSLEITKLAALQRAGQPISRQRLIDIQWALRSLLSGCQEQARPTYWRYWRTFAKPGGWPTVVVSQQTFAEVGRASLIDVERFPETMAGIRQVQAREVERALGIVTQALEGFPDG